MIRLNDGCATSARPSRPAPCNGNQSRVARIRVRHAGGRTCQVVRGPPRWGATVQMGAKQHKRIHHRDAAQPLATTKTGRHTRAVPRCSGRSVCGDAGLAMGAPASARGTAKQEFQRRCSKAMHAEHADGDGAAAPPVARCRQRLSVDIECVGDGLGAARKHQRVLRASPYCICAGFFSVLRRHSHATHPFPAGCRKFVARCSDFEG